MIEGEPQLAASFVIMIKNIRIIYFKAPRSIFITADEGVNARGPS